MLQRAIRFPETTGKGVGEVPENRRFSSPTAFIRHVAEQELSRHNGDFASAEQLLDATSGRRCYRWRNKALSRLGTAGPVKYIARIVNEPKSVPFESTTR
jgi:hypothetical protein